MATGGKWDISGPELARTLVQLDGGQTRISESALAMARWGLAQEFRAETAERRFEEEEAIVTRIWAQLGDPSYAELKGRSIYDKIDELKACTGILRELIEALPDSIPGAVEGPLLIKARLALSRAGDVS